METKKWKEEWKEGTKVYVKGHPNRIGKIVCTPSRVYRNDNELEIEAVIDFGELGNNLYGYNIEDLIKVR